MVVQHTAVDKEGGVAAAVRLCFRVLWVAVLQTCESQTAVGHSTVAAVASVVFADMRWLAVAVQYELEDTVLAELLVDQWHLQLAAEGSSEPWVYQLAVADYTHSVLFCLDPRISAFPETDSVVDQTADQDPLDASFEDLAVVAGNTNSEGAAAVVAGTYLAYPVVPVEPESFSRVALDLLLFQMACPIQLNVTVFLLAAYASPIRAVIVVAASTLRTVCFRSADSSFPDGRSANLPQD